MTDSSWPPVPTKLDWVKRVLMGLCLTLAATSFMIPPGRLALGIVLSALLAGFVCALMEVLTKLPVEDEGRVTERDRR